MGGGILTPEVSVIIPVRNEHPQLWFTIDSIQEELLEIPHEIIVVFNENTDRGVEFGRTKQKFIRLFELEKGSIAQSRRFGAEQAKGRYLFFLDAHVLVESGSFRAAIELLNSNESAGICWFAVRYLLERKYAYGYTLHPRKFWGNWTHEYKDSKPWPCLMSGLAGAAVSRNILLEVGNFHPSLGIYGGSEPYVGFKMEMFGYRNYVHPNAKIAHFVDKRDYYWNNDDLWHNFLLGAYILGDDTYFDFLVNQYRKRCNGVQSYLDGLERICSQVKEEGKEDKAFVEKNAKLTLQEVYSNHGVDLLELYRNEK